MRRRQWFQSLLLVGVPLLASCGGARQMAGTLTDLQTVATQLATALHHDQIRVFLNNGRLLSVGVINSPWNALPTNQKQAKAFDIARLAYKSYPSRSDLSRVGVTFGTHQTYMGIFTYDHSTDAFAFKAADLAR